MILIATKSFVAESGGGRHEVHKGDLISDSHSTARAFPKNFAKATERDIVAAVERARA